ncbi:hypothetical protein N7491_003820 [Penicillium cf. griseofulvum]|uniref:Major facilitator superfamily (MFS) profile domain-containing protein n=1 Tax=Penicillium cf. griseofulvum TaxID=2972120 RepID=A0A9W9MQL0_9EURO|nr:hypothetical protein N7472_002000 [Penicillium cf. griseofulvum]KAJ5437269.1 hypothetical protein N7445_005813 [Penicillium cf. griseofulvum]KAJ5441414.1 hypothetical protein N7491_003820 [Penicillium cf. griseofulvum]
MEMPNESSVKIERPKAPESTDVLSQQCNLQQDSLSNRELESDVQHVNKFKIALIIFALAMLMFLLGLDSTIVSTAIPRITDQFHAIGDVGWYASAYMLTFCALQLIWGKLYTFLSPKWTYLGALFIFELGSLICGVAPSSVVFITGRAIAGAGSGGGSAGSFLLVAHSVPQKYRPIMVGIISSAFGLGSIAGPLLGGAFTDNSRLTWRWCFYINLPLGFVTAVVILLFIQIKNKDKINATSSTSSSNLSVRGQIKQMDLPGTVLLVPGIVCLLLALQWGGTKKEWNDGSIIALFVLTGILLIGFITVQILTKDQANVTIPLHVFRKRNVWASALFGAGVLASFFTMLYYIPIWFQAIKDASAIKSGIMTLPTIISFVVASTLGGTLTSITGYYAPFAMLTVILMSTGTGLLTTLQVHTGAGKWIGYQILFGAGSGLGIQCSLTGAQTLPIADVPIGTAIILFFENLTGAVMLSVAENVFTNRLVHNLRVYVPDAEAGIVSKMGVTEIRDRLPRKLYASVLVAYNAALTHTFYVGLGLACAAAVGAVCMRWDSVENRHPREPPYESSKGVQSPEGDHEKIEPAPEPMSQS